MRPSSRIAEIIGDYRKSDDCDSILAKNIDAIINFLDEQNEEKEVCMGRHNGVCDDGRIIERDDLLIQPVSERNAQDGQKCPECNGTGTVTGTGGLACHFCGCLNKGICELEHFKPVTPTILERNALIDELVDKFENTEFQHIWHQCITIEKVIKILKSKKK